MNTLKFIKIKNIVLLVNILFTSIFASPTTELKAHNIGNVFDINELETIGYIQVDEELRTELLNSFNLVHFQSGNDIFKNFFDIWFFLIMDKAIGNANNLFRANIDLSKNSLHENQAYQELLDMFNFILMKDDDPITLNQFLDKIDPLELLSDIDASILSIRMVDQLYHAVNANC